MARMNNPYYGSPADAAWGQVTNNLVEAIFGDPQAAAQAKVQRAQIEQMNADARLKSIQGDQAQFQFDNYRRFDPRTLADVYLPQDSAAVTPQPPMAATSIGGVPMAAAPGGAQAVPNGQGGFTWVAPVSGARVSSGFGPRTAPMAGASTNHGGIDLAAAMGVPVAAAGPGTVLDAWNDTVNGGGNSVRVQHPDGSITGYAHLNDYTVKKGDAITGGQRIGSVGATGRATGPHLHMTYRANANAPRSDPSFILRGGQVAAPSGVAAAMTGGSVGGQPVGQVAAPQMLAEPGGARVDPRRLAETMGMLYLAGADPAMLQTIVRGIGAFGDDQSQRGAQVFQGQQAGDNFAASRNAQLNNIALDAYNDTAKTVSQENIQQVGQTGRQNTINATIIRNNDADNAQSNTNNIRDNATSRANTNTSAQATITAAGVKAAAKGGERKVTAADSTAMSNEFKAAVPVADASKDTSLGDMRGTVLATAGNLFRNGEAASAAEAVQMALQAHGVNQGPSSSDPERKVWRWQREPKAVSGQRVVSNNGGGASKVIRYDANGNRIQ